MALGVNMRNKERRKDRRYGVHGLNFIATQTRQRGCFLVRGLTMSILFCTSRDTTHDMQSSFETVPIGLIRPF